MPGEVPIWLDNLVCYGSESRLLDCPRNNELGVHNCVHEEDASVTCLPRMLLKINCMCEVCACMLVSVHNIYIRYTVCVYMHDHALCMNIQCVLHAYSD